MAIMGLSVEPNKLVDPLPAPKEIYGFELLTLIP